MKTKNKQELIRRMRAWLKKPGNNEVVLAYKLGLKTSFTVVQWGYRGDIPKNKRDAVKEIISSGKG